jgi:hypothetical protein
LSNLLQYGGQTTFGTPWHIINFGGRKLIKTEFKNARMNWKMSEYINGWDEILRDLKGIRVIIVLSAKVILRGVISFDNRTFRCGTKARI